LITAPIKVISKPEQIKKKEQPSKKRSLIDMLVESVTRIEKKQEAQQTIIEQLLKDQTHSGPFSSSAQIPPPDCTLKKRRTDACPWQLVNQNSKDQEVSFDSAFSTLIKAFSSVKPEEKGDVIRKAMRNCTVRDTERLAELMDLFWAEGMKEPLFGSASRAQNNFSLSTVVNRDDLLPCCTDCPHKQELERIDTFYQEFLANSGPHPSF